MYKVLSTQRFRKDLKKLRHHKKILEALELVIEKLTAGEELSAKYQNHKLKGDYQDAYECHIFPDLLLIYEKHEKELVLLLLRVGSHSELF